MRFIFVFVYVSAVFAALPLAAQEYSELVNKGRFDRLFEIAEKQEDPLARTRAVAWTNSVLGRQDLAEQGVDGVLKPGRDCLRSGNVTDGAKWVVKAQAGHKVVMFSTRPFAVETHLFLLELLPQLKDLGFTHLALDAVHGPGTDAPEIRRFADGINLYEPILAALIRRARELGFELVFDAALDVGEYPFRLNSAQKDVGLNADILIHHIQAAEKNARYLVLAGPTQIAEQITPSAKGRSQEPIAAQLRKASEIDPLTVDLMTCRHDVDETRPTPSGWLAHDENGNVRVHGAYADAVDGQIALPMPKKDALHAGYYRQFLGKPVFVPDALRRRNMSVLVQARRSGQSTSDAAIDRILLRAGENLPLYLPRGEDYFLISYRGDGHVIAGYQMRVD